MNWKKIYLSLGSNLGDREQTLRLAIGQLAGPDVKIRRVSSVYETEPLDFSDQPWFLNLVLEANTRLFPLQLLARIQQIEAAFGRRREIPKGPRTLDIDILLYANVVMNTPQLQIPHPRMSERRFVLEPLAELAPQLRLPTTHRTIRSLLESTANQTVRRL